MSIVCPFNKKHFVAQEKMIFHIVNKCQEYQRVKHQYGQCRYNCLHFQLLSDLDSHQANCAQKAKNKPKLSFFGIDQSERLSIVAANSEQSRPKVSKLRGQRKNRNEEDYVVYERAAERPRYLHQTKEFKDNFNRANDSDRLFLQWVSIYQKQLKEYQALIN